MKPKLITLLNECMLNKTIEQQNALASLISLIDDDKTDSLRINYNKDNVYISLWYDDKSLYSIMINDSNLVLFSLPDDISRTYVIENSPIGQHDNYNMQYSVIKSLLIEQ